MYICFSAQPAEKHIFTSICGLIQVKQVEAVALVVGWQWLSVALEVNDGIEPQINWRIVTLEKLQLR